MAEDNKIDPVTLDMSLDDIEDLPGYVVPLSGAYHVVMEKGIEEKHINEHPALQAELKIVEVHEISEQAGDGETPPKPGDTFTAAFMLDNKFGAGAMKEFMLPIAKQLGVKRIGEVVEQSKGLHLLVIVRRTYNKEKDRHYMNIKQVAVV